MTDEQEVAYQKAYYAAHRENLMAKNRQYRETHREETAARNAAYKAAHREELADKRLVFRKANRESLATRQRAWNAANPEYAAAYFFANRASRAAKARQTRYGITPAEYDNLLERQSGLCAGCGIHMAPPNVDHDHATGRVRGLLCFSCNAVLGLSKDSPDVLLRLVDYLTKATVRTATVRAAA